MAAKRARLNNASKTLSGKQFVMSNGAASAVQFDGAFNQVCPNPKPRLFSS